MNELTPSQLLALAYLRVDGRRTYNQHMAHIDPHGDAGFIGQGQGVSLQQVRGLEARGLVKVERRVTNALHGPRCTTWEARLTDTGRATIEAAHTMHQCEQMVIAADLRRAQRAQDASARQSGVARPDLTRFEQTRKRLRGGTA